MIKQWLFAVVMLLISIVPSWGGQYVPYEESDETGFVHGYKGGGFAAYSDGSEIVSGQYGIAPGIYAIPGEYLKPRYGAGSATVWGVNQAGIFSGDATSAGTVTVKYKWVPDNFNDSHPPSVVVRKESAAVISWYGPKRASLYPFDFPFSWCDNGLGDPTCQVLFLV